MRKSWLLYCLALGAPMLLDSSPLRSEENRPFRSSEFVANFPADSGIARAAGPIVYLQFDFEGGASAEQRPCTGAVIGGPSSGGSTTRAIVTAKHCIDPQFPGQKLVRSWAVPSQQSKQDQFDQFRLSLEPTLVGNCPRGEYRDCADIALLAFEDIGSDPRISRLPAASIFIRQPRPRERLMLFHHPNKSALVVTRQDCWVTQVASKSRFYNNCETEGGSSGALVFAEDDGALLGIHHGRVLGQPGIRRATSIAEIENNQDIKSTQFSTALSQVGALADAAASIPPSLRGQVPVFDQLADRACLIARTMTERGGRYDEGPAVFFFDWDSTRMTPSSLWNFDAYAGDLVKQDKQVTPIFGDLVKYRIDAHTDRTSSDADSLALSKRMAQSVANVLTSRGVSASRIEAVAWGESRPRVDTEDGVREPQNRRVELSISAKVDPQSDIGSHCHRSTKPVFYLFDESIDYIYRRSLSDQ